MATAAEIFAALDAFNEVRVRVGGIKTLELQVEAMKAALEAAERERAQPGETKK